MANKKNRLGMLVLVLVFGMTVVGCDNGTTKENDGGENTNSNGTTGGGSDVWSDVTSFSQLNGTWKAPSTATATGNGFKYTAQYSNYTITFNSNTKTLLFSGTIKMTFSDGNINELWPDIKEGLLEYVNQEDGVTVSSTNDTNHSITMTFNNYSESLDDDYIQVMGPQINQNGTKLIIQDGMGFKVIYTKQ